jgi:hypothetical protein
MMKMRTQWHILCIMSMNICTVLYGRTIQTPLPFEPFFREQLYAYTKSAEGWQIEPLVGGYSRKADTAFASRCDHLSHNPGALAALFFNTGAFTATQALAGSTAPSPFINPFLNSLLTPRIKYTDSGVVIMVTAARHMNDHCDIGFRTQLPFRIIEVTPACNPGIGSSVFGGETIADVTEFKQENVGGATVDSFAFRLDFLSQLPADCQLPGLDIPFVNYHNASFPDTAITISNLDVTDNIDLDNNPLGPDHRNAVTVLQSNGIPQGTLGVAQSLVQTLPALSGDGTSLMLYGRARFVEANNYTPLGANPLLESQMWIVPTVDVPRDELVSRARIIETQVERLLTCIQPSAEAFFTDCAGTSFSCQKESGVGDMDAEMFARYYWCDSSLVEGFFGLRIPTGNKARSHAIFSLPLGNNGHTEVRVGGHVRWQPCNWFVFNGDALYAHACGATETVAAPFQGATVKNLGPYICANIAWNYVQAHLDATWYLMRTWCIDCSWHLGYEVYQKWRDQIHFNHFKATDCFSDLEPLNPCLLTRNTQVLSHKVYGDLALESQPTEWLACRLFAGFDIVVAGERAPKEHGFHVGAQLSLDL